VVFLLFWKALKDGGWPNFNLNTVISFLVASFVILFVISLIVSIFEEYEKKQTTRKKNKPFNKYKRFEEYYQYITSKKIDFVDLELQKSPQNGLISENSFDYIINEKDFVRKNNYDSRYIDKNRKVLFHLYGNKCPLCEIKPCEHIDHFFVPKSKGGNLIMKKLNGELVNNAVPLCSACNLKKSNYSYTKFFSPSQIDYISQRNAIMTSLIRKYHT
jgi:5-methylcytosine-specific restriction endonuclease McrA